MRLIKDHLAEYFVVFFWFFLAVTAALLSGPRYNPDASAYYTTAIRVSHGDFWRSVDGVYAPLLSWLLVPGLLVGMQLETIFRIINVTAFLIFLICSKTLFTQTNLAQNQRLVALTVLGSQGFFLAIAIVSSDMLVAATCSYFFLLMHKQVHPYLAGLVAALAYLAKAAALPILTLLMFATLTLSLLRGELFLRSWVIKALMVCLLTCIPWIIIISIKYGEPLISAQTLIAQGRLSTVSYSGIGDIPTFIASNTLRPDSNYNRSQASVTSKLFAIASALKYFWKTSVPLVFGVEAFALFILLAIIGSFTAVYRSPSLLLALIIHCVFYLWFLGPYFRYYLPIMPIALILAMYGWIQISRKLPGKLKLAFSIILLAWCFSISITNIRACLAEPDSQNNVYVSAMATLPIIRQHSGVIVGDSSTPLPPLLAAHMKREYWQDLNLTDQLTTDVIERILKSWDCEQFIWFKERDPRLASLSNFAESGPFLVGPYKFFVYTKNDNAIQTVPHKS